MNTGLIMSEHGSLQHAGADLHQYARVGDKQALERCLSACLQPAYRQAYAQLGNDADAQDVVQESLLQLVRNAQRYDPECALMPWLAGHVTNACMHFMRSAARRKRWEGLAMSEMSTTPVSADMDFEHDLVRSALAQLKEKDRAIISLHYFAGLSQADTGKALGISENAASVRLHRARTRMKKILENQGVGISISGGAVAALALLPTMAQAAPLASATLLPQVIATCTAATLPSTLISLSLYNKGIIFMSTHTVFTTVSVIMLTLGMCTGAIAWAADEELVVHNPIVIELEGGKDGDENAPSWNPAAANFLAFNDENAVFRIAADADAVRALLLNTRPLKQLLSGDNNTLLKNWQEEITRYQAWAMPGDNTLILFNLLPIMRGVFVQNYVRLGHHLSSVVAMDMGDQDEKLVPQILWNDRVEQWDKKIGDYAMYSRDESEYAVRGSSVIISSVPAAADKKHRQTFHANLRKKPKTDINKNSQKYPLWMTINALPLLKAYLPLSAETQSPVEDFLGAKWKTLQPRLDISFSEHMGNLRVQGKLRDVPTAGPLLAALLIMNENLGYDIRPPSLRLRAPQHLPAADSTALAEIRLGCDIEKHAVLRESLAKQLQKFGLSRLLGAWNGELLLRVHAGIPMPQPTIVLGLRASTDALRTDIAQALTAFGAQKQTLTKGYTDVWTILTPVGMLTCALAEDRLIVSAGFNLEKLLEKSNDVAGLSINIDLPQIAQTYAPLAWGMIPRRPNFFKRNLSDQRLVGPIREQLQKQRKSDESGVWPQEVLNSIIPQEKVRRWLGNNEDIHPYVSVWESHPISGDKTKFSLQIVYHTQNAYVIIPDPRRYRGNSVQVAYLGQTGPSIPTVEEVKGQLQSQGAQHIAGVSLDKLKAHPRGAIPVFDRQRHIPSLSDIIAALPQYTLRWYQEKNGEQHFEEIGLPLMGVGLCAAGIAVADIDPIAEERANKRFHVLETHKKRLADLQRIVDSMEGENWKRPSAILHYAPADALSALGVGEKPNAQQINTLGRWYGAGVNYTHSVGYYVITADAVDRSKRNHGQVYWVLPLEKGIWAYMTSTGVGINTSVPAHPVTEIDNLPQGHTPDKLDDF